MDEGTGYGRKQNSYDPLLTEVGPGTPMGELLRRYWHPIAVAAEVPTDAPQRVRLLGEDLILFRDKRSRPGLVREHCIHRGSSLFYGRIEEDGIRCAYHGWKFDVQGRCLDQACEIGGGKTRGAVRQPWYPVQERYGVIWAYIGPPEKKPVLPRWQIFDEAGEDEQLSYMYPSFGYGPKDVLDYNWLQSFENTLDVLHAVWLHVWHSEENQFHFEPMYRPEMDTHEFIKYTKWSQTDQGLRFEQIFPIEKGRGYYYSVENIMPTISVIPNPTGGAHPLNKIQWHVPVDDTHFKIFVIIRTLMRERISIPDILKNGALHKGKLWEDCTPEELQRYPGDYEVQSTQGKIAIHANEHLAQSDTGVVMIRRMLRSMIEDVKAGKDPINVSFDQGAGRRSTVAYSFMKQMPAK
jgi:phenylpropionate dioxygenase-like ring-hydroxylating dioxygenase large terminal subunit